MQPHSPLNIKKESANINSYAFITLCGGREGQKQKITDQLCQLTGMQPIAVTELEVNQLLPEEEKNQIKFVTPYRIKYQDFSVFKKHIQEFVNAVFKYTIEPMEKKRLVRV